MDNLHSWRLLPASELQYDCIEIGCWYVSDCGPHLSYWCSSYHNFRCVYPVVCSTDPIYHRIFLDQRDSSFNHTALVNATTTITQSLGRFDANRWKILHKVWGELASR